MTTLPSYTCPACWSVSYNTNDIASEYCSVCKKTALELATEARLREIGLLPDNDMPRGVAELRTDDGAVRIENIDIQEVPVEQDQKSKPDISNVDIGNNNLVTMAARTIAVMRPPMKPLTKDEALVLAAWLVVFADPSTERFHAILDKVMET